MLGALIPTLCVTVAALLLAIRAGAGDERPDVRACVLLAMLGTGLWASAGAELLGLFGALSRIPVLLWWTIPFPFLAFLLYRNRGCLRILGPARPRPDTGSRVLLAITIAFLAVTGIAAARLPTNTWDCWTYHLPRQFYWIQQQSLAHFPSHDLRQLEMPPFAEILGVHWKLLSGGDGWSNMGQWFALLGCTIASSAIARELGAGTRGQSIAALLSVSSPGAIVQAMNGKNDVVLALWILTLAWLGARVWRQRRCTLVDAAAIGAALGLALYTKGTAYIIALPVCIAIGLAVLRIRGPRGLLTGAAIALVAASINAGHWQRNYNQFGSPLGQTANKGGYKLLAGTYEPRALASGIIKNTAAHLAFPGHEKNTTKPAPRSLEFLLDFGDRWNAAATRYVSDLHERMDFDPNDERTSSLKEFPYEVVSRFSEDGNSTSPAHLAIAGFLLAVAAARPRTIRATTGWVAFAVPFASFVAFAVMLRWQPWQFRLEIPCFALLAPVAGRIFPELKLRIIKSTLTASAAGTAFAVLCVNNARPLVGTHNISTVDRQTARFQTAPWARTPIEQLEEKLRDLNPASVGHALGLSPYEHFVIRAAMRAAGPETRITPLWANRGPEDVPVPEIVVAYDERSAGPLVQPRTNVWFQPVAEIAPFTIYSRADIALPRTDLPVFYGWKHSEGLDRAEGPYPQWDLPLVRWARAKKTTLVFETSGGRGELIIESRRNDRDDQGMTVRLNGQEIHRFVFGRGWAFFPHRLELDCLPGRNTIEIEYDHVDGKGTNARSVLYRRLQILAPLPAGPAPSTTPHAPTPSPQAPPASPSPS
jgi:hypothetical protein